MSSTVQLPSGTKLEYIYSPPPSPITNVNAVTNANEDTNTPTNKLAILLHPWSWLGGTMHDPVLQLLLTPLLQSHNFHILAYNSRSVGHSSGFFASLTGSSEIRDLHEFVQWAIKECVPNVGYLLLIGYSYGSLISSNHLPLPVPLPPDTIPQQVKTHHILLSYPLSPLPYLTLFHSKTYTSALHSLVRSPTSRLLVVYGDSDEFTSATKYRDWADELAKLGEEKVNSQNGNTGVGDEDVENQEGEAEGRVKVSCIPGGSHFWAAQSRSKAQEMLDAVEQWLNEQQL